MSSFNTGELFHILNNREEPIMSQVMFNNLSEEQINL